MKICLLGLDNLPVLAPEYRQHAIGGESVQQTLLARALARRGHQVSMVVADYGQADGAQWDAIRVFKAYRPEAGVPVLRFIHPRWTGLWAALARADAELYYTSCAGMHVGLLALFCRRSGRRFVFRTASDSDCDPARLLVRFARDRWLYAYGLRRAGAILVQSAAQAETLARSYGLAARVAGSLVEQPAPVPARPLAGEVGGERGVVALDVVAGTQPHDQMVVLDLELSAVQPPARGDGPSGDVDRFDVRVVEARGGEHSPCRGDDLSRLDPSAQHLADKAVEGVEVVAADDGQLDLAAPDRPLQSADEVEGDVAASQTRHMRWLAHPAHRPPPRPAPQCSPSRLSPGAARRWFDPTRTGSGLARVSARAAGFALPPPDSVTSHSSWRREPSSGPRPTNFCGPSQFLVIAAPTGPDGDPHSRKSIRITRRRLDGRVTSLKPAAAKTLR